MTSVSIVHTKHFPRLAHLTLSLFRAATRVHNRRALMGLLNLPDYLLKDIGLQRDEITREGLKRFWDQ
jgi:uncharacterized protein YjiS (DUF1127 family)